MLAGKGEACSAPPIAHSHPAPLGPVFWSLKGVTGSCLPPGPVAREADDEWIWKSLAQAGSRVGSGGVNASLVPRGGGIRQLSAGGAGAADPS